MPTEAVCCYISFGSNLGDSERIIGIALDALRDLPESQHFRCSALYRSRAVGPGEQRDYINGVVAIETRLDAHDLLDHLQLIEQQAGRERRIRWGARTLDIDLLLFGNAVIDSARLTVPHPRIAERNFVLFPLADIAPTLEIPGVGRVSELCQTVGQQDLRRLIANEQWDFHA